MQNAIEIRYKTYKSGRRIKLCIGKDNTCPKEYKHADTGLCQGCTTGFNKLCFKNRKQGEEFVDDRGIRFRYVGTQPKHLCIGDNNTCKSLRKDGSELCDGHLHGNKRYPIDGLKAGDLTKIGDELRMFNGHQRVKICKHEGCKQTIVNGGFCKTHSPAWRCPFAGCGKRRVTGSIYCNEHKTFTNTTGNVMVNKVRKVASVVKIAGKHVVRSRGEVKIAKHLMQKGIDFMTNASIRINERKTLFLDTFVHNPKFAIEFDGEQHFKAIPFFGGMLSYGKRFANDMIKDQTCVERGIPLLRIAYTDEYIAREIIDKFMEEIKSNEVAQIYGSPYYADLERGYQILNK